MNINPLISIIVPVYNVEKYIHRSINSLLKQTYKKIEIILVDDGSPDNCPMICDEYAKKDNRIKVIHKINGGLSDARNAALDIVTGEYITFVDSDDFVSENLIELLVKPILKYSCEITVVGANIIDEAGNIYSQYKCEKSELLTGIKLTKTLISNHYPYNFVWGKMFKAELFHNIRFPVNRLYEDIATTYLLTYKAKNVFLNKECGYYYFLNRPDNITSQLKSNKSLKSYYDLLSNWEEIYDFCIHHNELSDLKDNIIYKEILKWILLGLQSATKLTIKDYLSFLSRAKSILNTLPSNIKKSYQLNIAVNLPILYYLIYPKLK